MVDFVEYVVSELKSKRLGKANALELIRQFFGRPTASARLHPLVHLNISTLTQQRYRTQLTGDEFFLRDHRVRMPTGSAVGVLPGVAYLEMARAAIAVGIAGVFMETHPDPKNALCDGPNAVPLKHMKALLEQLLALDRVVKAQPLLENDFSC